MPIIDARFYKTLLICPHKAISTEIAPVIAHGLPLAPVHTIREYVNRRIAVDLLKQHEPKICFLDCATDFETGLSNIGDLLAINPALQVVALLPSNNTEQILKCLRKGAVDFLTRPFGSDQMDAAVEKIAKVLPAPAQRSGASITICVLPAKGACGATTVASNLAFQAKRMGAKKVLLADLDPLTGTISFLLKLKSNHSFLEILSRQGGMDSDLWKQMVQSANGVDVLLSPDNPMDGLDSLQDASSILHFSQALYDVIVVDVGDAYSDWSLSVARNADEILLVATNELPALQAAQRALNHLEACHIPPSRVRVIINRYDHHVGIKSDLLSQALETEIYQVIPSDYDAIQRSLIEAKPVASGTQFAKSLSTMADKLGLAASSKGDPDKKSASLLNRFSFLSR